MQEVFHTVYRTTNRINGKFYIGKHTTPDPNDNYIGSGVVLSRAVKKHGVENFVKEVVAICDTETAAYALERELIEAIGLCSVTCYNACHGGVGFWKGMTHSLSARDKISAGNKGKVRSDAAKAKMSRAVMGRRASEETKDKLRAANVGKTLSKETRLKISSSGVGRLHTPEAIAKISLAMKGRVGNRSGIPHTEETKAKISATRLGVPKSAATKEKLRELNSGANNPNHGTVWITDGNTNMKKLKSDLLPIGWRRGRTFKNGYKQCSA